MSSSRRFRRSKIYDLNYNIGENYYRSAVDRLEECSRARPSLSRFSEPPPVSTPIVEKKSLIQEIDDELELSRERASKAIQRKTVFDRPPAKKVELETDFDEQVKKSLERIAASKKLLKSIDLEDGYESHKKSSSTTASSKLAAASAAAKVASAQLVQKRTVKVTSDVESSSAQSRKELAKWSNDTDYYDSQSFAKVRARQSARQLADIEQEMTQVNERQMQREQRMSSVRKLLAENSVEYMPPTSPSITNGVASLKITKTTSKKVSTY